MSVVVGEGLGLQVNKFEQVSSDDHQMSIAGGGVREQVPKSDVGWEGGSAQLSSSEVWGGGGRRVPYLFNDGCDIATPSSGQPAKTLPSRSFVFGR